MEVSLLSVCDFQQQNDDLPTIDSLVSCRPCMENLQGLPVANSPGFSVPDPNLRDSVHWAVLAGHRAAALELSELMPSHTPAEDP